MPHQLLGKIHQISIGGIGPVKFTGGEFGIVTGINAFVAEVPVQLENLLKTAHQQPFEVQFRRDAHIELQIKGIMLRQKGFGRRAARNGLHHGRFHFHKAAIFQKTAEFTDDQAALLEYLPCARGHNQIDVALTVARFRVFQAVILLRQRAHGSRNKLDSAATDGQFARLRAEQVPRYADDVAHVQLPHHDVDVFGQILARGVTLDAAALILNMEEQDLAERAQRDNAARNGHDILLRIQAFPFQIAEILQNPADRVLFAEVVREQRHPGVQEITGFDNAILDDLVQGISPGEPLKHGHEVVRVRGLGIQLDFRLLLFPLFHDSSPGGRSARHALRLDG